MMVQLVTTNPNINFFGSPGRPQNEGAHDEDRLHDDHLPAPSQSAQLFPAGPPELRPEPWRHGLLHRGDRTTGM